MAQVDLTLQTRKFFETFLESLTIWKKNQDNLNIKPANIHIVNNGYCLNCGRSDNITSIYLYIESTTPVLEFAYKGGKSKTYRTVENFSVNFDKLWYLIQLINDPKCSRVFIQLQYIFPYINGQLVQAPIPNVNTVNLCCTPKLPVSLHDLGLRAKDPVLLFNSIINTCAYYFASSHNDDWESISFLEQDQLIEEVEWLESFECSRQSIKKALPYFHLDANSYALSKIVFVRAFGNNKNALEKYLPKRTLNYLLSNTHISDNVRLMWEQIYDITVNNRTISYPSLRRKIRKAMP